MELQPLVSDAGLWSILPPLLAIALAIATRDVVFSLFLGICAGLGIYAAQAPVSALKMPVALGNVMRPVTDKFRISREKLAYFVDATAAPPTGSSSRASRRASA